MATELPCAYFDADRCRSCTWLATPYDAQLAAKQRLVEEALATVAPGIDWHAPYPSALGGFRNKAKMAVFGTAAAPTIGIIAPDGTPQDLRHCPLHEPAVAAALTPLGELVRRASVPPYDIDRRRGELKYLLVTGNPRGELMVRFVLRSEAALPRLVEHLPGLYDALPGLRVVSANLHPQHVAVLEGPTEVPLSDTQTLDMPVNDVTLRLRPRSFFQTNTGVAEGLYREARSWAADAASVGDLYCGVGGFALHLAGPGRAVTGVEVAAEAVVAATEAAAKAGVEATFVSADAMAWAQRQTSVPEVVVVNPPRRGIGAALASYLNDSGVERVLYSSCNPRTLSADLAAMPELTPVQGRLFDMFPHTGHAEVLVELRRGLR